MTFRGQRRGTASGFVLVIALCALVLMAILLVSLLEGALSQGQGAESAATIAREKMLADSTAALVIGQIQAASTQPGVAWISQPGLIRTFAVANSRAPVKCYKLYSASPMTDASGNVSFLAGDVPADWNSAANQSSFTDLNAPTTPSLFGNPIYPILDPAAFTGVQGCQQ